MDINKAIRRERKIEKRGKIKKKKSETEIKEKNKEKKKSIAESRKVKEELIRKIETEYAIDF